MSNSSHQGHRERLRNRYAQSGAEDFADHQLLELLLMYAIPRKDTNDIAHRLIERFSNLSGVLLAETNQLKAVEGVGEGTALYLRLLGSLNQRLCMNALKGSNGRIALKSPLLAGKYALAAMRGCSFETVGTVCLNSRREVLSKDILQRGSLTEALVYPRAVAETALLRHAHSVLLIHNHPSGNPLPSSEDVETTDAVRSALSSIGVQLADHLITGETYAYSFSAGVLLDIRGESVITVAPEAFDEYRAGKTPALKKVMEKY